MGTSADFIQYVCDQIAGVGELRPRKMFGEYMVYVNDKPILLVCDNTVYVKKMATTSEMLAKAENGVPYPGTKEHHILDIDNAEFSKKVVSVMEPGISVPKPRKKKRK